MRRWLLDVSRRPVTVKELLDEPAAPGAGPKSSPTPAGIDGLRAALFQLE